MGFDLRPSEALVSSESSSPSLVGKASADTPLVPEGEATEISAQKNLDVKHRDLQQTNTFAGKWSHVS